MGIILWLIFGALAGWIASMLNGSDKEQGWIGNILLGIVGAMVGGFIASRLLDKDVTGFNLPSLAIAVAGALIFSWALNLVTGRKAV
jgi:uncharacterized membrane protein YeaQ/YmgE (transglycosylase-associated protein family)